MELQSKLFKAAIYVRLSKEDGDVTDAVKTESNSISNQRELIKDFLKDKNDIEVVSERVDDGFSGVNFDRPAFQAMLEDIRKGLVDCVVVKDLSRFGRNYIDSGRYIEQWIEDLLKYKEIKTLDRMALVEMVERIEIGEGKCINVRFRYEENMTDYLLNREFDGNGKKVAV